MTWHPVDLSDALSGGPDLRPVPTILTRDDGAGLFYAGMVNGVHGESGSGKTWLALVACAQQLANGRHVVYIDHEGDPFSIVGRLLDLGADADTIATRFHYFQPDTPFLESREPFLQAVHDWHSVLVVIDSTGEGLALDGAKPNADEEVAQWFRDMPRAIANVQHSDGRPAVVLIDHSPKANGGELWPIGSQRKRAAITGAQHYVQTLGAFSRERAGAAKVVCAKDRHGRYPMGEKVATLNVTPGDDGLSITLRAPDATERTPDGTWRPTGYMEKISRLLEARGEPLSTRQIRDTITGKNEHIAQALQGLTDAGHVVAQSGPRNATLHRLITPYRESGSPEPLNLTPDDRFLVPGSKRGTRGTTQRPVPGTTGNHSGTTEQDTP